MEAISGAKANDYRKIHAFTIKPKKQEFSKIAPVTQEELNMGKDAVWKKYFSDNGRYADIINGIGCKGKQLVKAADLCDADSRAGKRKDRDLLRRTAFGMNFALIGVENQETIDYSLPLRNMVYDAEEYEKQAAKIRKTVREEEKHLSAGEYLYGFKKDSRLKPVITFILYSVRRHIVGGENRTLISVKIPLRLCRIGTCRRLKTG